MRGAVGVAALVLSLGRVVCAADLARGIREAMEASPVARSAFWGIQIVEMESGKTLFQVNENRFFVPASNTKLFTTALALVRLGPDHLFQTTVRRDPDGSLRLVGGGDPNLSHRAIPYRMGPATGDPLQAIEDLADQVVAHGVRRVAGDVIGDDSAYVWEPFGGAWGIGDPLWEYGAAVSALTVNDNSFALTVQPGRSEGAPGAISLAPALEYYQIDNRVRTDSTVERRIRLEREPGSTQLHVWGTIPRNDRGLRQLLGVEDPALYAARALYDTLTRRGVQIAGRAVAHHRLPDEVADLRSGGAAIAATGEELARRMSPPLVEDLKITDKVSQNLHAEMMLRAVGRARRNMGSREAGLEEMKEFLEEIGIAEEGYHFTDGSGLSRQNLVTPAAVVKLLRYMHGREHWMELLPIGGQDGTLSARFGDSPASGRIRAKTGTLTHVTALSGYAERRSGGALVFSVLVNNYNGASGEIRAAVDKICSLMVE